MIVVGLLMLMAVCGFFFFGQDPAAETEPTKTQNPTGPSVPASSQPPTQPPVVKESTATVGVTGDLLLHDKVIKSGYDPDTNTYNYDNIFTYFATYASKVDYAVANLEVTLCGDDNGYKYAGYPCFNAPDAIVDAAKKAGFDMLLTANNHSYDTGFTGFMRTQEVIADRNLDHIGTRYQESDKNYLIKNINGIQVGMICYTYNTGYDSKGNASLNSQPLSAEATRLINSYSYTDLDSFYEKLDGELSSMRAEGAETIMLYIHWGDEYHTTPNAIQKEMAQKLCDMGIEVIVGNHAHVAQPVELLSNSKDENRKTLCLYSTGNAVSNIRDNGIHPAESEDGMLFCVTFAKYSDGTVIVESADILPTWVNRYPEGGKDRFQILTMDTDDPDRWSQIMNLTDELLTQCKKSYDRTMKIVGAGLETANTFFAENQDATEQQIGAEK